MKSTNFQKKIDFIKKQGFLRFYSHTNFSVSDFYNLIKDEKIRAQFKEEEKTIQNETITSFRKLEKLNKYLGLENVEKHLPTIYDEGIVWIGVNYFYILLKNIKSGEKFLLTDKNEKISIK